MLRLSRCAARSLIGATQMLFKRDDRFVAVEHLVTFLTERRAGRSTRGGRDEDADSPDSADTEAEHEC